MGKYTPVVSHQRKGATVCFVYGSVKTAPGISSGLRVTGVLVLIALSLFNLLTTVTPRPFVPSTSNEDWQTC